MPNPANYNTEMSDARADYRPFAGGYVYTPKDMQPQGNLGSSLGNAFGNVWNGIKNAFQSITAYERPPQYLNLNSSKPGNQIPRTVPQYNVQTGNSAAGVEMTSPAYDSNAYQAAMQSAIDEAYRMAEFNNAFEREQAENMMNFQREMNQKAMEFNALEAAKSRDWSEMMSNTAHQREIADLKAAGLNPVLSASGGNGAWAGSAAAASGVTSAGAKGSADTAATTAALDAAIAVAGLENQYRIAQLNSATTLKARAMTGSSNMSYADKKQVDYDYWQKQQEYSNAHIGADDAINALVKIVPSVLRLIG